MPTYQTSLPRAFLGLLAGALVGAALVACVSLWGTSIAELGQRGFSDWSFVFLYALPIWAIGLALVAPLPWFLLHRRNVRSWTVAAAAGAILTFIAILAILTYGFGIVSPGDFSASSSGGATWINGRLTARGWTEAAAFALAMAPIGAAVGLVIARVAYRGVSS
jgi:hypothetical protein